MAGVGASLLKAAPQILGVLAGGIFGVFQNSKANRLERQNVQPLTAVDPNLVKNVGQAELMAQQGMTSQAYNNATNQLNSGLTAGLRQAGRMGGTASIASVLRANQAGFNNLTAQNAQLQQQNQRVAMQSRSALAQDNQRVFNWNKAQPYLAMQQRIASLRSAGNQNIFGGIGALASAGNSVNQDQQGGGEQSQGQMFLPQGRSMCVQSSMYGFGSQLR